MPVMGIDLGTGGVRAIVLDVDSGEVVARGEAQVDLLHPNAGWSEQDPRQWWTAACTAIARALKAGPAGPNDIDALGLSGQMHGCTMVDVADQPLRNAILWNDQRTLEQCAALAGALPVEDWRRITGKPPMTGLTLPSLQWVRDHDPKAFAAATGVLLPKDFLRLRLTGDRATDMGDASGTMLLDLASRSWSTELLDHLELDRALLPKLHEGPQITGTVTGEAAVATGLRQGTPVVAGGGDQQAGGIGCGICAPGTASLNLGTSGVVFAARDGAPAAPPRGLHAFCHSVPCTWHVMGVVLSAGGALRWWRDVTGEEFETLAQEAAHIEPGAEGVCFKPYLTGERTPHEDASLTASFRGLRLHHERAHMTRSVFEGIAFALRDAFDLVEGDAHLATLRFTGGASTSPFWRQLLADTMERPVITVNLDDGSALGAALLASVPDQDAQSLDAVCTRIVQETSRADPACSATAQALEHWRGLTA